MTGEFTPPGRETQTSNRNTTAATTRLNNLRKPILSARRPLRIQANAKAIHALKNRSRRKPFTIDAGLTLRRVVITRRLRATIDERRPCSAASKTGIHTLVPVLRLARLCQRLHHDGIRHGSRAVQSCLSRGRVPFCRKLLINRTASNKNSHRHRANEHSKLLHSWHSLRPRRQEPCQWPVTVQSRTGVLPSRDAASCSTPRIP